MFIQLAATLKEWGLATAQSTPGHSLPKSSCSYVQCLCPMVYCPLMPHRLYRTQLIDWGEICKRHYLLQTKIPTRK
ncbi:hypothetical protein COCSUDRAFT_33808 [Coccomyxa subellipsoidea C-169]|uniref:Uncharacterized protein n=1 Tax=Coccomyxa subellipsoidea (strain C-169) TaxID=574566 RepID=I0YRY4_COCSC|nr:hypothetical protein COCSUDRAFT_33808 [Coccomyxa subellipsoidea C-169]EIE21153.1 hypothetical protein COCSUDRAFT_33808 [Coccomyxa subellipsoidea C-169]|eukprot:XP_005645697.1 hypothetical protein COCSUDRAFT_33808 [Coccomyxa subellipsoidea C-169]